MEAGKAEGQIDYTSYQICFSNISHQLAAHRSGGGGEEAAITDVFVIRC